VEFSVDSSGDGMDGRMGGRRGDVKGPWRCLDGVGEVYVESGHLSPLSSFDLVD